MHGTNFLSCIIFCRHLDRAKRGVSVGGLGILAKHRKKQHLLILLDSLRTIKTLVKNRVFLLNGVNFSVVYFLFFWVLNRGWLHDVKLLNRIFTQKSVFYPVQCQVWIILKFSACES